MPAMGAPRHVAKKSVRDTVGASLFYLDRVCIADVHKCSRLGEERAIPLQRSSFAKLRSTETHVLLFGGAHVPARCGRVCQMARSRPIVLIVDDDDQVLDVAAIVLASL